MKAFGIAMVLIALICGGAFAVYSGLDLSSATAFSSDSVRID